MTGEIMKEVGDILKEARIEKGYTLDDIQKMTKIQKKYLIAVEDGDEESLPGSFYARAFIRQYAEKVGLDGDQLIEEHGLSIPKPDVKVDRQTSGQSFRDANKRESNVWSGILENLPTILIVVLVVAVLVALYFAFMNNTDSENSLIQEEPGQTSVEISSNDQVQSSEDQEEAESDATDDNATDEENTPEDDTEETEDGNETESSVTLESNEGTNYTYIIDQSEETPLQFTLGAEGEAAWVSIAGNGQNLQQGTLQDGETFEVEVPENTSTIEVSMGNAPSTLLSINGESVDLESNESTDRTQQLTFEIDGNE